MLNTTTGLCPDTSENRRDNITFYLYIDDNEQGKITNAKLYDVNGDLLESKDYNTPKDTLATATIGIRITIKRE